MSTSDRSTRRRFFRHAGAALSVPLAATTAFAARPSGADASAARLAALEAGDAIRTLQQTYARLVNAGALDEAARLFAEPSAVPRDAGLRRLAADWFAANDVVVVAPDGENATARLDCTAEMETPLDAGYTLVDMARQQGEGTLRAVEHRTLESSYVKRGGAWKIASLVLRRT